MAKYMWIDVFFSSLMAFQAQLSTRHRRWELMH